ncbi:Phosphotriesterase homology protein [Anaerolineales bacterium]|nr:Phosphotriesterase homology protein [Anaerolineales bacterium]
MKIRTILGDISPSELGVTTCHEHLLWSVPEPYVDEDPDLGFDSIPAAVAEARYFKSAGGNALVEMTTAEIGRCPVELRQIAEASGLHVIAATGHHKEKFSAAALAGKSVDEIANGIITDINLGMSGTDIKAGVIKAASSQNTATDSERRVIHAVGLAHEATGAPVSTHTEAGTFAIEQANLLNEAGVPFERMLIGHLDRRLPRETYLALARLGVHLGFDQIGKNKYWPDAERVSLIKDLIAAGHVNQILLSGDTARKSAWHVHNPRMNGLAHLLLNFVPAMREAGVNEKLIHTMLVENPARFLAF